MENVLPPPEPKQEDFASFLNKEVYKATMESLNPDSNQGKTSLYPTASALASDKSSFGAISPAHSFLKEPVLENIILPVLKSGYLTFASLTSLVRSSPLFLVLWKHLVLLRDKDFSKLQTIDSSYDLQEAIPQEKVTLFLACALHYNLDLASVIRYTGGNYTSAHTDIKSIVSRLQDLGFNPEVLAHLYRSRTVGCPAYFNAESTHDNFMAFLHYGNHSTIKQHTSVVLKAMNKEVKHCHAIPFPRWIARFCPNLHLTPQGILLKQAKKPRPIWDGSFLPHWWCKNINSMQKPALSPESVFGTSLLNHLTRLYNLRITYTDQDILVWDDDVAGTYR